MPLSSNYRHLVLFCNNKHLKRQFYEVKMNNKEKDMYLVIGVEDGWVKVDKKVWQEYLEAKERLGK